MTSRKPTARTPVRFGGRRTRTGYVFELTGGALCLDLANTLDDRKAPAPRELLAGFTDLVAWGAQAGAIGVAPARALLREAHARPRAAARVLGKARRVREAIFAAFSAVARGLAPPPAAIAALNEALPAALAARRLVLPGSPSWTWVERNPPKLDRVLWPVILSAAELLTSGERGRVRECEGERCAWLFLDRSRNGSRRWCDMTVCGNRAKAGRHRARAGSRGRRAGARGDGPTPDLRGP